MAVRERASLMYHAAAYCRYFGGGVSSPPLGKLGPSDEHAEDAFLSMSVENR